MSFRSTISRDIRLTPAVRRRATSGTIAPVIPTTGLVDWWDLIESSGTRSGAANATALAEANGTTSTPAYGLRCQSLVGIACAANTRYLATAGLTLAPGSTGVTVAGWIRPRTNAAYATIMALLDDGGYRRWQLAQATTGLYWYGGDGYASHTTALDFVTWRHVVCRYNPTGTLLDLFVDGSKQTSATATNPSTAAHQLRLQRGDSSYAMTGEIGQVGLWSRPLSDAECVALYNGGVAYRYSG